VTKIEYPSARVLKESPEVKAMRLFSSSYGRLVAGCRRRRWAVGGVG